MLKIQLEIFFSRKYLEKANRNNHNKNNFHIFTTKNTHTFTFKYGNREGISTVKKCRHCKQIIK